MNDYESLFKNTTEAAEMPKRVASKVEDPKFLEKCSHHSFTQSEIDQTRGQLLNWYDREQRTLPWRSMARDAKLSKLKRFYVVWVSEVMLQQTQVTTVIDYFNRWINKWPTIESLAKASVDEANQMWAGLGYYSRCRRLLEGAKKVVDELNSEVPEKAEELSKTLPGVGKYTASAIASIVFSQPVGVVDGNVIRVLTRLRSIGANPTQPEVTEALWQLAHSVVDLKRPGDFNQALMELGATVCKPTNPECSKCPLSEICTAYNDILDKNEENKQRFFNKNRNQDIEDTIPRDEKKDGCKLCFDPGVEYNAVLGVQNYPGKKKKTLVKDNLTLVLVVKCDVKYLLCKRPDHGLLGGLLEFVNEDMSEETMKKGTVENVKALLVKRWGNREVSNSVTFNYKGQVRHKFSHINQIYDVWLVDMDEDDSTDEETDEEKKMWMTENELMNAAISTAMKKVFKQAMKADTETKGLKTKSDMTEDHGSKKRACRRPSHQKSITSFFGTTRGSH